MPAVQQHLAATATWQTPGSSSSSRNAAVVAAAAAAIAAGSSSSLSEQEQQQRQQELATAGAFVLPNWLWLGDAAVAFPEWHAAAPQRLPRVQQQALLQGPALAFNAAGNLGGGGGAADDAAAAAGRGVARRRQVRTLQRQQHQNQQLVSGPTGGSSSSSSSRTASASGECSAVLCVHVGCCAQQCVSTAQQ
jgi:hypothetical protein